MTVKTKFQTKNIPNRIFIQDIKALKKRMLSSLIYSVIKKWIYQDADSGFSEFSIK